MAWLNHTRKRSVQLDIRQQEAPYFPIVKYIYPDKSGWVLAGVS